MNQNMQRTFDLSGGMQQVRHQVLRNTYWLLALSMIPTVLGAFIGVQMHLPMLTGGMGFIIFMAVAFGFMYAIEKTKNCLLYTSPSPRDATLSRMPSSA